MMDSDHVFLDVIVRRSVIDNADQRFQIEMTVTLSDGTRQDYGTGYLSEDILGWVRRSTIEKESGADLFNTFFDDAKLLQHWTEIRGAHHPYCHIRFGFAQDETLADLHTIPWELLHDTTTTPAKYISANQALPFSRYVLGTSIGHTIDERPANLLAAVASPNDLPGDMAEVKVDVEQGIITNALAEPLANGQVDITWVDQPVTLEELEDLLLAERRHILHIVAHGRFLAKFRRDGQPHAFLYLATTENAVKEVMDTDFAKMLQRLGDNRPEFIFLASCQTAKRPQGDPFQGFAPALLNIGVPAVLAMQENIHISTARKFTRTFYRELFQHGYVDLASNAARATVLTNELHGSYVPVLFSRLPENRLLIPQENEIRERKDFEPEMVYVRAGKFWMGSDDGAEDERPKHSVELEAYRIGTYPVTNRQYAEFLKANYSDQYRPRKSGWFVDKPPAAKLDHPVVGITWHAAVAYCNWLRDQTDRAYRLATEAEWEKAARGVDGQRYPWGELWEADRCNIIDGETEPLFLSGDANDYTPRRPGEVTPFGCYAMVGHIQEWTNTIWGEVEDHAQFRYPYKVDFDQREAPRGPSSLRLFRIYRGGDYLAPTKDLQCSRRGRSEESIAVPWRGFRVACDI